MTEDEVIAEAAADGFELEERGCGDDTRWPCYGERRQAINWMRDRLNRIRVFA